MLISAEHLSINFGSRQLLQDVDFYLNEGDKTGVIGINGTGKSGIDGLSRRALRPQPAEGPARPDQDRLQSAHEHVRRDAGPVCERRDPLFLHGE